MLSKKDPDVIKSYLEDTSNLKGGYTAEVAIPENIEEVSQFLASANSTNTPVTITGGGTSTTGSRIPFGGVVLSTEKLNKILSVSVDKRIAIVQTGVMVDELKIAADKAGLFYTSHPTEGTASIGGTVATNASGSRSFKYGPTRNYIKRLKMVLANGEILDLRRGQITISRQNPSFRLPSGLEIKVPIPSYKMPSVKNAAGYYIKDDMDLIDIFIGQEGTLSVIVEIEVGLVAKPAKILSSFVFFNKEEDAWNFSARARDLSKKNRVTPGAFGIDALSIEYFDVNALAILRAKNPNVPADARAAIFFEQEVVKGANEDRILDEWLDLISKCGSSADATWVAMNEKEAEKFTAFRHSIPEAINDIVRKNGFQKLSTDIAVPDKKFIEMMNFYKSSLKDSGIDHVVFGHIGENHVHGNLLPKSQDEAVAARDIVMSFIKKGVSLGGTVSAEHGIGKIKHRYLEEMYGTSAILEMSKLKRAFDPNCILGLDNIFPRKLLS